MKIAIVFSTVYLFFLFSNNVMADSGHILINEVYSDPNAGESEWIELYNPTDSDIDLTNFSIEDGTHKPVSLAGRIIDKNSYLVLYGGSGKDFTFGLNNSGDYLILKDNNLIVDQLCYGDWDDGANNPDNNAKAPDKGKSISRKDGVDTDIDKDDFFVTNPTPDADFQQVVYSEDLIISEIVPEPESGSANEFIEIFNRGNTEIDLSSWQIDDIDGGSSPYTIPAGTKILPNQYVAFYQSSTKISFNDTGDSGRLLSPDGIVKNAVTYSKSVRGQSYSLFSSNFLWSTTLTPNAENILTVESASVENDSVGGETLNNISEVRKKEIGAEVVVTGTVTVIPGAFSSTQFYIQDDTGGVQIYCSTKCFPDLKVGDRVAVTGEISQINNERRIKISSISDVVIIANHDPPEPEKVTIDEIGDKYEGKLIQVVGTVISSSGSTFYIHGSGELKVYIKNSDMVKKPRLSKGDRVQITGILTRYNDGFRLLPIDSDDVMITSSDLTGTGTEIYLQVIVSIVIYFTVLICKKYLIQKLKPAKLRPISPEV